MAKNGKIILGFSCNNRCIFCYDRLNRDLPEKTTKELKKEITSAFQSGVSRLNLLGGEPTIRPDIIEILIHAKNTGFNNVMITTNGRMLAYSKFAREIIKTGISQIVVSIHGASASVHDALTGCPGSFKQLIHGVENLKNEGFNNLGVNTTIVIQSYKHLPKIADMLTGWNVKRAEFIYIAADLDRFALLTPKVSSAAPFIRDALDKGKSNGFFWKILNPPLGCYLKDFFDHVDYAGGEKNSFFLKTDKTLLYQKAEAKKHITWQKPVKCGSCLRKDTCFGISAIYLKKFGDNELKPIS
jgi:sulfatase maturation enzyme AslB (radical SAM superfamily)